MASLVLTILVSLAILAMGAHWLVLGASRLARWLGLAPLTIGLTIVAYGTSAPELMVSSIAAWEGNSGIAVANVVGSNTFNVLFILGICALILPLKVSSQLVRIDVPIMIGVSIAVLAASADGQISAIEGGLFIAGIVGYTVLALVIAKRDAATAGQGSAADPPPRPLVCAAQIAGGLGLLMAGGHWLVDSAAAMARSLGVGETVIGLTIVAIGTSTPEIATSLAATLKGERDLAVGNVIGSNIYNILGILGLSGVISGTGLPVESGMLVFDIPVMIATAIACLPIFMTGHSVERWEGGLFLLYYFVYATYLVLHATDHSLLSSFSTAVWTYVVPLSAITLVIVTMRSLRSMRTRRITPENGAHS